LFERDLIEAVLAGEALIALTSYDRAARALVLDTAESQLSQQACRIVRLRSFGDQPLDLQCAMNQVVGQGGGGADRVERFFDTIALPVGEERHIVLIIDDAARVTADLLSYLALIGPTTVGQDLQLQVVFSGDPTMWDTMPRAGNLGTDRITRRIVLNQIAPADQTLPQLEAWPEPEPEPEPQPVLPMPRLLPEPEYRTEPRPPPTDGYEALRYRLAQQERGRKYPEVTAARVLGRIVKQVTLAAMVVLAVGGSITVYVKLPALQAAARQIVPSELGLAPTASPTVTALIARGNWLLQSGDVPAARAVFENAALDGSASAVTALAKSNDPSYLAEIGAHGVVADAMVAVSLYRRAAALGDREAADRLSRLQAAMRH